ncbi:MAG: DUF3810 domain-containing protein [Oscillospiraceae bacterium]|nr:DUF3810 domain-containing protein [Oscillospiraceae bacterium]
MKKALIYLAITLFINIAIRIISRLSIGFSEWYAMNVYPLIVGVLGRFYGSSRLPVVEILLYILIHAIIAGIIVLVIRLVKRKNPGGRRKTLLNAAVAVACVISTGFMLFLFGCEINYQRRPFSYYSGLELGLYNAENLRGVILEVIDELHEITPRIETGEQGQFVIPREKLDEPLRAAMNRLGEIHPPLDTYYPRPKPVIMSEQIMSQSLIAGIFSPFTIEALYNAKMPDSQIPFTALHELSHLSGFMREDEANFIGFLACRESGDNDLRYSGYTSALGYLLNAYFDEVSLEEYHEIYREIPPQVVAEFQYRAAYWDSFRYNDKGEETAISAAATAVNNAYLVAQGQEDGVKSYGRFVDLLLADYLDRN